MSRAIFNWAIAIVAAASVGAGASGCAENDQSLVITQLLTTTPMQMCTASVSSMTSIDRGLLDVSIVSAGYRGYNLIPVVQNNTLAKASSSGAGMGTIESDNIDLIGVDIRLEPSDDIAALLPPSTRSFSIQAEGGLLAPGGGSKPLPVEVVPASIALAVAPSVPTATSGQSPTIVVKLRPVGTLSGSTIIGSFVDFPVELCNGCLTMPQQCPVPKSTEMLGGCYPYLAQDVPVSCCTPKPSASPAATSMSLLCGSMAPVDLNK